MREKHKGSHAIIGVKLTALFVLMLMRFPLMAATYYVDGSVASSGDGQSWATAWKNFSNITGLQAGDTVYISGGTTSQSYSVSNWTPTGGTSGNPITYAVGQGAGHSGVVTITSTNFLNGTVHDVIIDGNVGGAQHWSVTPSSYFWEQSGGTNQRVTLRYITVPNMGAGFHWVNVSGTAVDIHHCNFVKNNDSGNMQDFIFFGGSGTGVGQISVHDNTISYPVMTSDHSIGDDMWIWPSNINFYSNTVQTIRRSTYSWTQHSDGFQTDRGSNIHVYNNTFIDPGESLFYEDSQGPGTVSSILIYNNLVVRTVAANGGAQRIFDMNPEAGGANSTAYVDVVIANNTIVDQASPGIFWCRFLAVGSLTRVYAVNNIEYPYNTGASIQSGVTFSNNYGGNGISFASYAQLGGANNDLHLVSSDSPLIGQGRDMSTYFTTDYSGGTRSAPWDIGAYAFATSGPNPPTGLTAVVH